MPRPEALDDPLERALAQSGPEEAARERELVTFHRLAGGATKAVIVGCGALGRLVFEGARAAGVEVIAFADNNPSLWDQTHEGLPIQSPGHAISMYGREAYFVIGIFNSSAPREQLRELGCERVVPFPVFFWRYAPFFKAATGLELPHRILARGRAVRTGYQCLADSKSRNEFAAQIAWRCTLDYGCLPAPDDGGEIYFPRELIRLTPEEVLVDCGAFDGDSIRLFLEKTSGAFRHVFAYEPDRANRRALELNAAKLPAEVRDRISVLPFAVGSRDGLVAFDASGTAGSRMSEGRETSAVECRRLDSLLQGVTPTIVKMDIEGAEPDALAGAVDMVRRARPILAVCAYHECEHLWTLPTLMKSLLPDYRIALRRYAEECWEMVCYAVPPERAVTAAWQSSETMPV